MGRKGVSCPPLNVWDIPDTYLGGGWPERLWPWGSGQSAPDHQALAHRALGPQPRPRFRSSQKFIPLNGVPCFALINLLNLPERSGNALPHPPAEEARGGSGGRYRGHPGLLPRSEAGVRELGTPAAPSPPALPFQPNSETPSLTPELGSYSLVACIKPLVFHL